MIPSARRTPATRWRAPRVRGGRFRLPDGGAVLLRVFPTYARVPRVGGFGVLGPRGQKGPSFCIARRSNASPARRLAPAPWCDPQFCRGCPSSEKPSAPPRASSMQNDGRFWPERGPVGDGVATGYDGDDSSSRPVWRDLCSASRACMDDLEIAVRLRGCPGVAPLVSAPRKRSRFLR